MWIKYTKLKSLLFHEGFGVTGVDTDVRAPLVAQMVKNLPAMQETHV